MLTIYKVQVKDLSNNDIIDSKMSTEENICVDWATTNYSDRSKYLCIHRCTSDVVIDKNAFWQ